MYDKIMWDSDFMKRVHNKIFLISIIVITLFLSIGYATINNVSLTISGSATAANDGDVAIINVTLSDHNNLNNPVDPTFTSDSIDFNLSFTVSEGHTQDDYYATYEITIQNDSISDYVFASPTFSPSIATSANEDMDVNMTLDDIAIGDTISAKTTRVFHITIHMYPKKTGEYNVSGETGVDTTNNDEGTLLASIPSNSTGDLTGNNTSAMFTATVANTYDTSKTFTFSINSSKFTITDSNGNALSSFTIAANTTSTYNFYIKKNSGVTFPNTPQRLTIYFEPQSGTKSSMGIVSLSVDVDSSYYDTEPPTISGVVATTISTEGSVQVSWTGSDSAGVQYYTVETYQVSGNSSTKVSTDTTVVDETSLTVSSLNPGTYFFKVYGKDNKNNEASASDISNCSTSLGYCSMSNNSTHKWRFTVTIELANATSTQGTSSTNNGINVYTISNVLYDSTVTTTLGGASGYDPPSSIASASITYEDGTSGNLPSGNSSQTAYNYNTSSYALNIYHVIGDIEIGAAGVSQSSGTDPCFVKGTKILLANGKYKNVEDIGYDDLLAVWNYDFGEITYEYPLWIENEHKTNSIIKITLSDGSYINIAGDHGFYDTDKNLFINIDDLKIGSNIAKIYNGKFTTVKVTNIENINEDTTYYFVGSTTYYNVIANDILTTDHYTLISNLYGFEEGAKWPKRKIDILNNKNNLLSYEYFKDVLPYYLYKGFRVEESGYLINNNILDLNSFKYYISNSIINPYMIKKPITVNDDRYWMVTTNFDNVTDNNKSKYLYKEGSIYTLPSIKGVKYWYSTADNKIYKSGDKVEVVHGLHFIANKLEV